MQNNVSKNNQAYVQSNDKRRGFIIPVIAVGCALIVLVGVVIMPILALSSRFRHMGDPLNQVFGTYAEALDGCVTFDHISSISDNEIGQWLTEYMESQTSNPGLASRGAVFARAGRQYNVNPALMVAIAQQESQLGKTGSLATSHYNPFGYLGHHYLNWDAAIEEVTKHIGENYIQNGQTTIVTIANGKGGTETTVGEHAYAPLGASNDPTNLNSHWIPGVRRNLQAIFGRFQKLACAVETGQCSQAIIAQAAKYAGVKYVYGGNHPLGPNPRAGMDCSSYISQVYRDIGIFPSHPDGLTTELIPSSPDLQEIQAENIQPGDLVLSPGHVVIYVSGDVNSNFMAWHAPHTGATIRLESLLPHPPQRYYRAKKCSEVATQPTSSTNNKTVVIDPGHGTADNNRENENYVNMQIALALKTKLQEKGVNVILTHTSGQDITPEQGGERNDNIARAEVANRAGAALMIRIHGNVGNSKKFFMVYPDRTGGKEGPQGPPVNVITLSKDVAQDIHSSLVSTGLQAEYGGPRSEYEYTQAAKDNEGVLIGSQYSKVPVALIEMAGVQTQEGRQWVLNNKDKYVQGMANGILKYLGSK